MRDCRKRLNRYRKDGLLYDFAIRCFLAIIVAGRTLDANSLCAVEHAEVINYNSSEVLSVGATDASPRRGHGKRPISRLRTIWRARECGG
jgi:hypothetical protein